MEQKIGNTLSYSDKNSDSKKKVKISDEDRKRMTRLYEEVSGRVEEMGRIVARHLEFSPRFHVTKFAYNTGTVDVPAVHMEFEDEIVLGDGHGCYQDPPGICCECPC